MLRRSQDRGFELLLLGEAIQRVRPAKVPQSSVAAVKLRVMASLGEQEGRARTVTAQTRRWIAIPAGIGLTAAVIAALRPSEQQTDVQDQAPAARLSAGRILFEGNPILAALPGQRIVSDGDAWLAAEDANVGLESGTTVRFLESLSALVLENGALTVAAEGAFSLHGRGWSASLSPETTARFESSPSLLLVSVFDGVVHVEADDSRTWVLRAGESGTVPFSSPRHAGTPPGRVGPAADAAPGAASLPAAGLAPALPAATAGTPPAAGSAPSPGETGGDSPAPPAPKPGIGGGAPAAAPPVAPAAAPPLNPPAAEGPAGAPPPAAAGGPPTDHAGNPPGAVTPAEPPTGPPADRPPADPPPADPPAAPPSAGDAPGHSASAPGQDGSAPGLGDEPGLGGSGGPPANPGSSAGNGKAPANPGAAGNGNAPDSNSQSFTGGPGDSGAAADVHPGSADHTGEPGGPGKAPDGDPGGPDKGHHPDSSNAHSEAPSIFASAPSNGRGGPVEAGARENGPPSDTPVIADSSRRPGKHKPQ